MSRKKMVERDAVTFGRFIKDGGQWHFAMLAARNTFKGQARYSKNLEQRTAGKVTVMEFAGKAGCSDQTVLDYRNKWDEIAPQHGLPTADEMVPGQEVDLSGLPDWPGTDPRDGTEERHVPKDVARERAKAAIKANPSIVAEAVKEDPKVADAAWEAIEEKGIERANNAALAAIQRGGKVTQPEKTQLGSAWAAAKSAASRGEALQALEDAIDVLEAAAKLVRDNGSPLDNEGEQIEVLNNRIIDVAAQLSSLSMEVAR